MTFTKIFAAIGLTVAALGMSGAANAHDRWDDRRWDHDRRWDGDRRWNGERHWRNERRWDRRHAYYRDRCWTEWHRHHRVRVCR